MDEVQDAPGGPGTPPTWSSSDKDMVTTALGPSRVWATLGHGIVNEVYWPSTGRPQIRDLGFIVAGPNGWTEVKRTERYLLSLPRPYVPLPSVVHEGDDFRLELEFLPHPLRDVLLIRFALSGEGMKLHALVAPHLNGMPTNSGFAGADLMASEGEAALCLYADTGFSRTSAGYVGTSDGWQDFARNGRMTWQYPAARNGNIALIGELAASNGILALGFSQTPEGARTLARSALADDYNETRTLFVSGWENWGRTLKLPYASPETRHAAELSAMVIKVHEDRTYAGAVVASLSVPWGASHDDAGGYHLVWTRDTVEAAFALITAGQYEDAGRTLDYLIGTQAPEGNWAQNYYPDGRGYWTGKQLDEVALPVLLASKLRAVGHLTNSPPEMAMVRTAIDFIVRNGPMSDQDRWEENAGASPFTLAVVVAALVTSADYYAGADRDYLLSLADCWNERIEDWTYVVDGRLGRDLGLPGYYIRLAPRPDEGGPEGIVSRRNVMHGDVPAGELIGMEFLYLVRTGLRSADDPRIVATVKLVDKLLAAQTPAGIGYYRYNGDGYGEHEDGAPFDGQGVGRLWPLLTGERGHFALAEGADVTPYLEAMMRMVGRGGLIPEQIWDSADITDFGLETGKPTGSAMPLVWAHSEFLKLLAAHQTGTPAEQFDAVVTRYRGAPPVAATWHWRETSAFSRLPAGRGLSIEATQPLSLHIGFNNWRRVKDVQLVENGLGMFVYHLHPEALTDISSVQFTFFDPAREQWLGRDFKIDIVGK